MAVGIKKQMWRVRQRHVTAVGVKRQMWRDDCGCQEPSRGTCGAVGIEKRLKNEMPGETERRGLTGLRPPS